MNSESIKDTFSVSAKMGKVIIIDDDTDTLATLGLLVRMEGLQCETYASATSYLEILLCNKGGCVEASMLPMCIFCDVNMPGLSGITFQEMIADQKIPLVLMSGDVGVKDVIRGFRLGIHDFLLKPINIDAFLQRMHQMLEIHRGYLQEVHVSKNSADKMATLTPREREVVGYLVMGKSNVYIAETLSISLRTVKFHRKNIYEKLAVDTVADLVKLIHVTVL
jgi:FixJ family two-component response regulator